MLEFGTDGVRGRANSELSVEFAQKLGQSVAVALGSSTFVVGRDTRVSGTMLEAAFAAGLCSQGASVLDLGVIPSPGVAFLCSKLRLPGAVISASHNPFFDNGIKIIGAAGSKLSTDVEAEIEALLRGGALPAAERVGTISGATDLVDDYVSFLCDIDLVGSLSGMRLVIDSGHGAASHLARRVFESYGAQVVMIHDAPDGTNINAQSGSTHLGSLQEAVKLEVADLGLAFDGDADRALAVDEQGAVIDGDYIMAIIASYLKAKGQLRHSTVAVTVMSNMGLGMALRSRGISVIETDVGDRNVVEAMVRHDLSLGGEQSGHIIIAEVATTGDGILTGLVLCAALRASGHKASQAASVAMSRFPQVLENISFPGDARARLAATEVVEAIRSRAEELGEEGRILVRASGTEPVIRVMVEARSASLARDVADALCKTIRG